MASSDIQYKSLKDLVQIQLDWSQDGEFKIIKLSPGDRKIGLSHKALAEDAERREYDHYRDSADGSATLADLFHAKDNS